MRHIIIVLILSLVILAGCKPREIIYKEEVVYGPDFTLKDMRTECSKYIGCDKLYRAQPNTPSYCCFNHTSVRQVRYGE